MYTQDQLDAIEQTARMIGGVMMEMDDPTGVGGVECSTLDMIYQRLQSLQQVCSDIIKQSEVA